MGLVGGEGEHDKVGVQTVKAVHLVRDRGLLGAKDLVVGMFFKILKCWRIQGSQKIFELVLMWHSHFSVFQPKITDLKSSRNWPLLWKPSFIKRHSDSHPSI